MIRTLTELSSPWKSVKLPSTGSWPMFYLIPLAVTPTITFLMSTTPAFPSLAVTSTIRFLLLTFSTLLCIAISLCKRVPNSFHMLIKQWLTGMCLNSVTTLVIILMDTLTSPTAILRRMQTPSKITLGHLISASECRFWLSRILKQVS